MKDNSKKQIVPIKEAKDIFNNYYSRLEYWVNKAQRGAIDQVTAAQARSELDEKLNKFWNLPSSVGKAREI